MNRSTRRRGLRHVIAFSAIVSSLMLAAQPANAAIMLMTRTFKVMGFEPGAQGVSGVVGKDVTLKVKYDTSKATPPDTFINGAEETDTFITRTAGSTPILEASYTLGTAGPYNALDLAGAFSMSFVGAQPGLATYHNISLVGTRDGREFQISLGGRLAAGESMPVDFTKPLERQVEGFGLFFFDHGVENEGSVLFSSEGVTPMGTLKIERLDVAAAVPEPAAWALMITGFGLAGSTLRRRRLAPA
jgi:hypothetical protein